MAFISLVLVILLSPLIYAQTRGSRFQARIENGVQVVPHQFPWMAMITNLEGIQACGGTLINRRFVLTAAHCLLALPSINPPNVLVRLGRHDKTNSLEPYAQTHRIRTIIRHPQYQPLFTNDFALLELETLAILNDAVGSICLAKPQLVLDNKIAHIIGWGYLSSNGPESNTLLTGSVKVLPMQICRLIYHSTGNPKARITDDMFCAKDPQMYTDACNKDSGGPLMVLDEQSGQLILAGIISWGMTCGSPIYPGVYARVSYARNWIVNNIGNTSIC